VYSPNLKFDKGGDENVSPLKLGSTLAENPAVPTLQILHRFINRFPDMFVVFAILSDETLSVPVV
jgi:hypothetical protein